MLNPSWQENLELHNIKSFKRKIFKISGLKEWASVKCKLVLPVILTILQRGM